MRRFLSLFLLFSFLLPQLLKVGIFISFKANQEYIAKMLCINKDKLEMQCNGNCHLVKKLIETENNDQKAPVPTSDKIEITLFIENQKVMQLNKLFELQKKRTFYNSEQLYTMYFIEGVFHPPQGVIS